MSCTLTVTGATGNTGHVVAETLLANGHAVRVVGRSGERLQPFVDKGAEAFVGSVDDTELLTSAYMGADAVYAMIPPNPQSSDYVAEADRISKAHAAAIGKSGVKNVVALSSIGAHRPDGTGIVTVLHAFENDLNGLDGVNVLYLRPAYFMDNIYPQIDLIKAMGFVGSPVVGDISMPVVHTRDIGQVAAARMMERNFKGKTVEYILGERNISYNEITEVLGKTLGRGDLKYVQFPPEQSIMGLQQFGFSANVARLIVELAEGVNNGVVGEHYERTPENTTATSLEQFAQDFAERYNQ
jgi:uncharacterized protein YbjT (DUF2867 family)